MVALTETLPCHCWLATIEAVGLGAQVLPICFAAAADAESHAAALAELLDLDQLERPSWRIDPRPEWHAHCWTPATSPARGPS